MPGVNKVWSLINALLLVSKRPRNDQLPVAEQGIYHGPRGKYPSPFTFVLLVVDGPQD